MPSSSILITGVSSFIGYHLGKFFSTRHFNVVGIHSKPVNTYDGIAASRLQELQSVGVGLVQADLTDPGAIGRLIEDITPRFCIHHAGWAKDYGSMAYDLDRAHAVNCTPLEGLYRGLKNCGCEGILLTGSSMEYSNGIAVCREEDACWPETPYGLAKLAATIRSAQLAKTYNMPTRVARVFIPFGSGDNPGKLIPTVIREIAQEKTVALSPCEQKRDFLYIEDLMHGYAGLIEDLRRDTLFDMFNLCSGQAIRLKELLLELVELMGADPALLQFGALAMRPGEPEVSFGANDKARTLLNWKPRPMRQALADYLSLLHELKVLQPNKGM